MKFLDKLLNRDTSTEYTLKLEGTVRQNGEDLVVTLETHGRISDLDELRDEIAYWEARLANVLFTAGYAPPIKVRTTAVNVRAV